MKKTVEIVPYKEGVVFVRYKDGRRVWGFFMGPDKAERLREIVERNRWLGPWQVRRVVVPLLLGYKIPASFRCINGSSQSALDRAAQAVGARLVLGPNGGRWNGYYHIPETEEKKSFEGESGRRGESPYQLTLSS